MLSIQNVICIVIWGSDESCAKDLSLDERVARVVKFSRCVTGKLGLGCEREERGEFVLCSCRRTVAMDEFIYIDEYIYTQM